jgi:hypothetical protein
MSAINRAALVALLEQKVLSGGKRTTGEGIRELITAMIESLVALIDDKDVNGGYLGIDEDGLVDVAKIAKETPTGQILSDSGAWINNIKSGTVDLPGNGSDDDFTVAHGLGRTPTEVIATMRDAVPSGLTYYVDNFSDSSFRITFDSPPSGGFRINFIAI